MVKSNLGSMGLEQGNGNLTRGCEPWGRGQGDTSHPLAQECQGRPAEAMGEDEQMHLVACDRG